VPLEGKICVKFKSQEGEHQLIEIQLPSFVHTNYFYSGRGYKYMLIDGPLVVRDKGNQLKAVVFTRGIIKQRNFCLVTLVPNIKQEKKKHKIEGLMYKYSEQEFQKQAKKKKEVKEVKHLKDVVYQSFPIQGNSMEYVSIGKDHSNYGEDMLAQPIPSTLASPSDIRFREDLVWARRNDQKRSKVFMGLMRDQMATDLKGKRLKNSKQKKGKGKAEEQDDMVIDLQEGTHLGRRQMQRDLEQGKDK